ncbi:MAG TPA: hypothetical protein PKG52_09500 [bacterium]|nr:hypothetical protein [bacterium]HPS29077.1 hypothetical protein [bacterium]
MKKKIAFWTPFFIFSIIALYFIYDIVVTTAGISKNKKIIENIETDTKKIEAGILETRLKMEKFQKDPKAAESILRNKFEMLRKDQYYINDKNH